MKILLVEDNAAVRATEQIMRESSDGDVLIFMPGERDIREVTAKFDWNLGGASYTFASSATRPAHGGASGIRLDMHYRDDMTRPSPGGRGGSLGPTRVAASSNL